MKPEDIYERKYKAGKTGIMVTASCAGVSLLLVLITLFTSVPGLPLAVLILLFFLGCLYKTVSDYREVILYPNRMEVNTLIDGVITSIYYSDIEHVGFLHGTTVAAGKFLNGATSTPVEELVILQRGNVPREMLSNEDYDDLHDICSFIQDKIGYNP